MSLVNIYKILNYASACSILIPLACSAIKFRTLNHVLRVLFIYLVISSLTEFLNPIAARISISSYNALQNGFTFVEFLLVTTVYFFQLKNSILGKVLISIALLFSCLFLVIFIYGKNYLNADSIVKPIEAAIMIVFAICYYFKVLKELMDKTAIVEDYYFTFINAAILIYFASSFLIFLFAPYLATCPKRIFQFIWILNSIANITYNSILTLGIWKQKA